MRGGGGGVGVGLTSISSDQENLVDILAQRIMPPELLASGVCDTKVASQVPAFQIDTQLH